MLHAVTVRLLAVAVCGTLLACNAVAAPAAAAAEAVPAAAPAPESGPPPPAPADAPPAGASTRTPAAQSSATAPATGDRASQAPAGTARAPARADASSGRNLRLRLTTELRSPLARDPQQRQAAAALWQALQKDPAQEARRLQSAESEMRSLREASQQNANALAHMREQSEQAQHSRQTATAMLVSLAVFLTGLLGWLAWRWRSEERIARVGRWFQANSELAEPLLPIVDAAAARRFTALSPAPPPPAAPAPASAASSGAAPAARPAQAPERALPKAGTAPPARSVVPSQPRMPLRSASIEELVDVHDKADFFLSIGEHGQAIAVLDGHIHGPVETSALAWMDLLEIYRRFGARAEYTRLRSEFQGRFAVQVPEFDDADPPLASLEQHGGTLARIASLWPSREVLDVIAESLFRQPDAPGGESFMHDTYRDLVLLYHIAQDMVAAEKATERAAGPATTFHETSLHALDAADATLSELDPLLIPPSSPRIGVDIDLDEAPQGPSSASLDLDFDISAVEAFDAPTTPGRTR